MGIYSHEQSSVYRSSLSSLHERIDFQEFITSALLEHRAVLEVALQRLSLEATALTDAALLLVDTLRSGHKVLVAGNGGSAAEAQHFASELVGRFKQERSAFAALALTADSALLTAVANDYGYQDVFARQVEALGQADDVLLAFSTSGESENLIRAALTGHLHGLHVIAITGCKQSRLGDLSTITIRVPGSDTATAQELHMVLTHVLCDIIETQLTTYPTAQQDTSIKSTVKSMSGVTNLSLLTAHGTTEKEEEQS